MIVFVLNCILLGVGLSMDAFSLSVANSLGEPGMKGGKMCLIAGTFAAFQALMPLLGWGLSHTLVGLFSGFEKVLPWLSLAVLGFLGVRMIRDGRRGSESGRSFRLGLSALLAQGVATSLDALSAGIAMGEEPFPRALLAALLIGAVTFCICFGGTLLGRVAGVRLSGKAEIFGGVILIAIGIELFVKNWILG